MKKLHLPKLMLLTVIAISILNVATTPVMADTVNLCIDKSIVCWTPLPPPHPYELNTEYNWWIRIRVNNPSAVQLLDVVVYDKFGAEFEIDTIRIPEDTGYIEYTLTYDNYEEGVFGATVDVEKDGSTIILGEPLGKDGITFDGITIYWTGRSAKAHFEWEIGTLGAGETAIIWVEVSTDTNPSGKQEFTSPGCYSLNSGATVKGFYTDFKGRMKQISDESDAITFYVPG